MFLTFPALCNIVHLHYLPKSLPLPRLVFGLVMLPVQKSQPNEAPQSHQVQHNPNRLNLLVIALPVLVLLNYLVATSIGTALLVPSPMMMPLPVAAVDRILPETYVSIAVLVVTVSHIVVFALPLVGHAPHSESQHSAYDPAYENCPEIVVFYESWTFHLSIHLLLFCRDCLPSTNSNYFIA